MRNLKLIFLLSLVMALVVEGRPGLQDEATLLVNLRSQEWKDRAVAVAALDRDLGKVNALGLREELLKLLAQENKVTDDLFREGIGTNGRYGEDFAEYYAHLLGVVFRTANQADPQTLRVLAFSSYNPDSQYARDLADSGGGALLPLAIELLNSDIAPKQWNALGLLGRLYEKRVNHKFSPGLLQSIKSRIVEATRHVNSSIRMEALRVLGEIGTREDIPLLQRVASSDPYVRRGGDGRPDRYLVRERAQDAIKVIEARFPR